MLLTLLAGIVAAIGFGLFAMHASPVEAATFNVNSSGDGPDATAGDGICDTVLGEPRVCTLRAAIQEANALNGADVINFPASDTLLVTELPYITERVTIDASANPDGFTINATDLSDPDDGLTLSVGSSGTIIRGIIIFDAPDDGLVIIGGANHIIGGDPSVGVAPAGQGNVIYDNGNGGSDDNAILITDDCVGDDGQELLAAAVGIAGCVDTESLGGHIIEGNRIGTTPLGTEVDSVTFNENDDDGIDIDAGVGSLITIGAPGRHNLISGNNDDGIYFSGGTAPLLIQDNWIGLGVNGNATDEFANEDTGIETENEDTPVTILNNTIAGGGVDPSDNPGNDAIVIRGSSDNTVLGNCIGMDSSCEGSAGGFEWDGVFITDDEGPDAQRNDVGDGTVAGRNIINNAHDEGVELEGEHNVLNGNYIGFAEDGESGATINGDCVSIEADDTEVLNNVMGNCQGDGIYTDGERNLIEENDIGRGTTATSADQVDFYCIYLDGGDSNQVLSNVMANCGADTADAAVQVESGSFNIIRGNDITSPIGEDALDIEDGGDGNLVASQTFRMLTQGDGDLAIDLDDNGVTLNDAGDLDPAVANLTCPEGSNDCHNYPVLAPISPTPGCARGSAGPFDVVRIFSKTTAPGVTTYEWLAEGTANVAGDFEVCLGNVAAVTVVGTSTTTTASTTDLACAQNCTSEFSVTEQTVPAGATPTPTASNTPAVTNTPVPPPTLVPTATRTPGGPTNTPVPPIATATSVPPTATAKLCGDVNDDGVVSAIDVTLLLQLKAALIGSLINEPSGDVNNNGQLTSVDAALILQRIANLIPVSALVCPA